MTIAEAIENCVAAAEDADAALSPHLTESLRIPERGYAYRAAMPPITSRSSCLAVIACAAHGAANGYLTPAEAKALLYAAQLALPLLRKRTRKPASAEALKGFLQ